MIRPKLDQLNVEQIAKEHNVVVPVYLVAIRGYYKDTMGVKGKNDRGIYDDAIFLVTPNFFMAVNANTDPSKYGKNKNAGNKGYASLLPGVYLYKPGWHKKGKPTGHMAFIQAGKVKIHRDGTVEGITEEDYIGLNIHRGGRGTSSEGCQTIPPDEWQEFYDKATEALKEHDQAIIPYILVDNT